MGRVTEEIWNKLLSIQGKKDAQNMLRRQDKEIKEEGKIQECMRATEAYSTWRVF
jgi:hypothetical protein